MVRLDTDPEDAIDLLIEEDIVYEDEDGALMRTESFQATQAIYHDTYAALGSDSLVENVVEVFGVSQEEAAKRVETGEVSQQDLIAYLSLQSDLDPVPDMEELAVMAEIVTQLGAASPVPDDIEEIDDDSAESFLAANPDTVVTVWKRFCDPCDKMKDDLDGILDCIPDDVAVVGIEGEACNEFVNDYDISAAPALVVFRDGEHQRTETGRRRPESVRDIVDDVYA